MKFSRSLIPGILFLFIFSLSNGKSYPLNPGRVKIENRGVNIAYTDDGKGKTTLLFVHGWCLNKSYWSGQVMYFKKKYRVITIDLPGFGFSGKNRKDWTTANFASDVSAVINQMHLKRVILVGHSMAGDIVLQAALKSPNQVVGLVGVDNFKAVGHLLTAAQMKNNMDALKQMRLHFKAIASQYFNQALFYNTTDNAIKKRILTDVVKTDSLIAISSLEGELDQMRFDESQNLRLYKKKLYLINSDYTPTDTSVLVAKHIAHKIYYIHATGHFPMVERPSDFNLQLSKVIAAIKS